MSKPFINLLYSLEDTSYATAKLAPSGERRNGLNELVKIIGNDQTLYEKVVTDLGATSTKFQNWWDRMSAKYQWESAENGHWEINFDSCEIFLVSK